MPAGIQTRPDPSMARAANDEKNVTTKIIAIILALHSANKMNGPIIALKRISQRNLISLLNKPVRPPLKIEMMLLNTQPKNMSKHSYIKPDIIFIVSLRCCFSYARRSSSTSSNPVFPYPNIDLPSLSFYEPARVLS